ncbi:Fis family transcriptional regulator [Idiomarina tyrosinivorans]|uniref:Fis family transcriptional regulator n=1 Tax=Idiomarina tyrosinivorans TaxID=1445662 RepID=A0A432ZRV6_9GAMM|nr:SoxR reducing system RseC family protein [Idiomarina tyrosinivorans]RUO80592.1 Fis family transcriptional regulator [Idiomarina tyrosinivorans]
MVRELGEVTAVGRGVITIATQLKSGCGSCVQQSTCGAGIISKVFSEKRAELTVETDDKFALGETVQLSIAEEWLTRFALLVYGLPIVALLVSAIALSAIPGISEGIVILLSFGCFGLTFAALKGSLRGRDLKVNRVVGIQRLS